MAVAEQIALKTGEEFKESLRDNREVWYRGEQVEDVTTHPATAGGIDLLATSYQAQHDPETRRTKGRRSHAGAPPWIERARELLHDRLAETRTLRDLAAEVGVHPAHFARAFRRHVGVTPGAYLRWLRLERAMRLLAETDRSLAQVARAAGFCDQSHLTRALRRETGCTPAAYRRGLRS